MSNKEKSYPSLENELKDTIVNVDGSFISLLNNHVEQIIINCHAGSIVDIKPVLKFK